MDSLELAIEVDKSGMSLLGMDESQHTISVATTDVDEVRERIASLVDGQP